MKLVQVSAQVWANAASGFMTEPDTPKKKAQDVKDLRCQLVERAEIFENSRGF